MTRMEELESCLSGLLSTLKKNREHVPLEVLKTDQKPEWLTWEQLLQYEKVMTETGIPVKNCSD